MKIILASLLVLRSFVAGSPLLERTNKPAFTSILVFGDSFNDNGNGTFLFTNRTWPADPAYFDGRFSNGPVWPEYLLDRLGAQKLLDLSFGGATINNSVVQGLTGPRSDIPVPSVVDQVNGFLSTGLTETVPCSTLTLLFAGVNDAFFGGQALNVRALTDSMVNSVKLLAKKGFRNFVMPETQAGALLPFSLLYTNASAIAAQSLFSDHYKGNLTLSLKAACLPRDVKVHLLDQLGDLETIIKQSEGQGLQAKQPCLNGPYGEVSPRTLCSDPQNHVFFDAFHPTTETHKAIAEAIEKLIS